MNAQEFREDQLSTHVDPLHDSHQDFDYDAVEQALGCKVDALDEETCSRLAAALVVLVRWLADVELKKDCHRLIGLRAIAAAWVVRPDLFHGMSQTELAELIGAKNKMEISRHAAEFSRMFSVRNRGQSHGWNYSKQLPQHHAPKAKKAPKGIKQLPLF